MASQENDGDPAPLRETPQEEEKSPSGRARSGTLDGTIKPDYCKKVLYTEAQIQGRVLELAKEISQHYAGKHLVVVGILKGAFMFLSDLVRHLSCDHEVEFMAISSYGDKTTSSGNVRVNLDLRRDVKDKHVLIVEDIIDTGTTLSYLVDMLRGRNPASVEVCPFLKKQGTQKVDASESAVNSRWVGFVVPNEFIVGYGLDFAERFRTLRFIGVLEPHVYQ